MTFEEKSTGDSSELRDERDPHQLGTPKRRSPICFRAGTFLAPRTVGAKFTHLGGREQAIGGSKNLGGRPRRALPLVQPHLLHTVQS